MTKLQDQIRTKKEQLQKAKPRSRQRVKLEVELTQLVLKQLKLECRAS